jgi:hypothetical protein
MKGEHKGIAYTIKRESGKWKPLSSIHIADSFPVAIEGVAYAEGKYLVHNDPASCVGVAQKIIEKILE